MIQKYNRWESAKYRKLVSEQPCIICGGTPSAPHHDRKGQNAGMGMKPHDTTCIPICATHHQELHAIGRMSFCEKYEITDDDIKNEKFRIMLMWIHSH